MRWGINGEREESDRAKMSKRIQRGREREQCLALISQSVAHPAAEAAFVTMTDPRCLYAARHQHHYSTLLMYTHTETHTEEREQHVQQAHTHTCGSSSARYLANTLTQVWLMCCCEIHKDTKHSDRSMTSSEQICCVIDHMSQIHYLDQG